MRIVLLGTGTNVGKTYVGAALAHALRELAPKRRVLALKPIETGVANGVATDALTLQGAAASDGYPSPHPLYAFEPPISPHLAAIHVNVSIDLARITAWVHGAEQASPLETICLVETAGGAFSPVNEQLTNVDLARALEPAIWVLVVPDALGALHDTRATLLAMAHTARLPDHVVVSAAREADAATDSTARELNRLGIVQPTAVLRRGDVGGASQLARTIISISP
jgi:dethiobiotin synthetase